MKIGIIGSGSLGSNVARAIAQKGLSATIANKSGPASMAALLAELGPAITAGTIEQAASADIVLIASIENCTRRRFAQSRQQYILRKL